MNTQVNWQRIRAELQRLADAESLKTEVQRISGELRKFDYHSVLSPKAAERVKELEQRYDDLMRRMHLAQRKMDREITRILKRLKFHGDDAAENLAKQKSRLEKLSQTFKGRFKAGQKKVDQQESAVTPQASVEAPLKASSSVKPVGTPSAAAPKRSRRAPNKSKPPGPSARKNRGASLEQK